VSPHGPPGPRLCRCHRPRYRALILLATSASLRWAELVALTPQGMDLDACIVRVTRQINYPPGGVTRSGRPSRAPAGASSPSLTSSRLTSVSISTNSAPAAVLLFTSPDGKPLRHSNYRRVWMPALTTTGLVGTHVHDLRHTGNQFTADAGANPPELMERVGHDSVRAALIYLHSSAQRQRALASEIGRNAKGALGKSERSGKRKARNEGETY
jgi:integrase